MDCLRESVPSDVFRRMQELRRHLHAHPELSGEEEQSAAAIAAELEGCGLEVQRGVGGHGLVVDLPGDGRKSRVALRVDMDALPVFEETGLSFASTAAGKMHACGHDGHAAMLLGAALLLLRSPAPAPVRLIWQPAEETATGALAMIHDGVLEDVAVIFGGHIDRHYPPGVLAISDGPVNAATDTFEVELEGQSGHGARPHEALDAVVAGSLLVTSLQTIVSREVNPAKPSVVSVGVFNAGTAPNVIAGRALLRGTIRAQHPDVQDQLHQSIERIARSIGQLHGAKVRVAIQRCTPALHNPPHVAEVARAVARSVLGEGSVQPLFTANMGGEDFAHFMARVPGCYIRFGGQRVGTHNHPAHSSAFDFDEGALSVGAAWFAGVARKAGERLLDGSLAWPAPESE